MKYAFMTFSTPHADLTECLRIAEKLGYAGIEPRVGRDHAHRIELERTAAERKTIARQAFDAGIEICCLALSTQYVKTSPALLDETRRYIDLATDIDCPRLRLFGGSLPEGMSREKAIDTVVHGLSQSAPHAASAGVTLCIETHDAWTHPRDVAEVLRRVNHPNVAVNWDIMHPFRTSRISMRETFGILRPWIRHVHVHDGTLADPLVLKPCGDGEIDFRTAFECLLEMEYDGFLSGEWIDAPGIDLADEISRMKSMESQIAAASPKKALA